MNCDASNKQEPALSEEVVAAVNDLPVLARLEFVRHLIFRRYGSTDHIPIGGRSMQADAAMQGAVDILDGVIEVLKKRPRSARLDAPAP